MLAAPLPCSSNCSGSLDNKCKFLWWWRNTPVSIQHGSPDFPPSIISTFLPFCLFFSFLLILSSLPLPKVYSFLPASYSNPLLFFISSSRFTSSKKHLSTFKHFLPCDFLLCCTVINVFRCLLKQYLFCKSTLSLTEIKLQKAVNVGLAHGPKSRTAPPWPSLPGPTDLSVQDSHSPGFSEHLLPQSPESGLSRSPPAWSCKAFKKKHP